LRNNKEISSREKTVRIERILGVIAILTVIAAWVAGFARERADVIPSLREAIPGASRFEPLGKDSYAAWPEEPEETLLGYIRVEQHTGYGGPVQVAVASDLKGVVSGISVVDHKETPSYFGRVAGNDDFVKSLIGNSYQDEFVLGKDVDAVSGATRTTYAVAQAVRQGIRDIAGKQLGFQVSEEKKPQIKFGAPEILLIALYVLGIMGRLKGFKPKKLVRWISLVTGLFVLGFIYNNPLTISMINQVLLLFIPQWQTSIYWFLLILGIVIFFVLEKKNPYCNWFCPFGAAQECLGALGKAKPRSPGRFRGFLKWLHRTLAWAVIIIALLFRNPGLSSYEVFGTLFGLVGSTYQFVLLGIVLIASLFIFRPWCNYLCPIKPVDDFIRMMRRWIRDLLQSLKPKNA